MKTEVMKRLPVLIPRSLETKIKGLLRYDKPPRGWGMLFLNVKEVHMIGMKFPIDVVFFDKKWIIRDIKKGQPGDRYITCPGATHTLEIATGLADTLKRGQRAQLHRNLLTFLQPGKIISPTS
ncbi:hypothetical protein LCGC14_2977410 [marine sediment metagenome]|uniref:DUF192 domain-containing protein n=1 Tax=marine sediment metagenome TaxID=412755 RepID=A0A0F8ZF50_9ZZZZ